MDIISDPGALVTGPFRQRICLSGREKSSRERIELQRVLSLKEIDNRCERLTRIPSLYQRSQRVVVDNHLAIFFASKVSVVSQQLNPLTQRRPYPARASGHCGRQLLR